MFYFEQENQVMLFKVSFYTITLWREHQYTTSSFLFFHKKLSLKNKKNIINISCSIKVRIKMRLLIFLVFSQYGLAYKYGIILLISICNWIQN